ncbi:uncharacterized protein LOC127724435 [Mytilus californianus]|uniref:uncharacterized protein LOC127724435 n=1 Tax=Mytilus californianus TaxID=6549 RepID=UPI00224733F3|nr:uncharacterized protein LOC127724435 [Mytilus californianus]
MADDTLKQVEKQDLLKSQKPLQCRFHDTEEYQIFCKDCKDFMCFKCLGQLHQKHDLSPLRDSEVDIRTEMEALMFRGKYVEQLTALSDKLSENKNKLAQDEENLNCEIRTSVEKMKQKIDLLEENILSELRNTFKSYQTTLQEQKTNVNNLQTEITNLDIDKLPEYNLNHIINIMSEMKVCSSTCDRIINHPKPNFKPTMEFSIGNVILSDGNNKGDVSAWPSCSDMSIQTDFSEDSDIEWFDAEDMEKDDFIESSSDEVTDEIDEYPINFLLKQDIKRVRKIVPISEKDAWIISNRKLLKIVDHSLQDDVYAEIVDDIVVLKDGCVLVLRSDESFVMKLLPNRRLVRFADVGIMCTYIRCNPYCICIKDDIVVTYNWSITGGKHYGYTCCNHIIWMNTDGIVTERSLFSNSVWKRPCSIQNLESGVCVLYRVDNESNLHCIELLEAKSDKCNKLYCFKGIYGFNPEKNFECKGMCVDKAGNTLVSDYRHHSVYVLDKELKYKKTLFDARNGLDKPAAIGVFNNHLWVADGNQIFIFNYECEDSS